MWFSLNTYVHERKASKNILRMSEDYSTDHSPAKMIQNVRIETCLTKITQTLHAYHAKSAHVL